MVQIIYQYFVDLGYAGHPKHSLFRLIFNSLFRHALSIFMIICRDSQSYIWHRGESSCWIYQYFENFCLILKMKFKALAVRFDFICWFTKGFFFSLASRSNYADNNNVSNVWQAFLALRMWNNFHIHDIKWK